MSAFVAFLQTVESESSATTTLRLSGFPTVCKQQLSGGGPPLFSDYQACVQFVIVTD